MHSFNPVSLGLSPLRSAEIGCISRSRSERRSSLRHTVLKVRQLLSWLPGLECFPNISKAVFVGNTFQRDIGGGDSLLSRPARLLWPRLYCIPR